ncbi:MAG TPA: carboxymuconolactone decarboxylase family protein [Myxococcota bacterium]|nr:carboxymuconolactone decarboxylase family protein [Myxococcota bacterium]HRY95460.1 carboxymuconolactone decarboxylase family protein [Myxococcota bacterium]HSA22129.1 carboxymuconolactone decarboxylase family protein [Myxococcota bacterium]
MDDDRVARFRQERERLNEIVLTQGSLQTKRFFALDTKVYQDGALPARTKELLGLVGSLVLRCDDCVLYHLIRCRELELSSAEVTEALDVGLVIGGSITIPHLRRAHEAWQRLSTDEGTK